MAVATGGAAFTAAGGAAGGIGGFGAGAIGGGVGSAYSYVAQGVGNSLYFKDPPPTLEGLAINTIAGGVLGGTTNGTIGLFNGRNFWNGNPLRTNYPNLQPLQGIEPHVTIGQSNAEANLISNTTQSQGAIQLNSVKNIDYGRVYMKLLNHGLSNQHVRDGILTISNNSRLGAANMAMTAIERNINLLQNGSNEIIINGGQFTVRAFVQNGVVVNADMFIGTSGRTLGNLILFNF